MTVDICLHGVGETPLWGNPQGDAPGPPTNVTSITRDAGATVSFREPADTGSEPITAYIVTPYIGGTGQTPTTVDVGDLGSITGSNGYDYLQADVTGLTNSTAYTFTVTARNSIGDSDESTASGANTPLAGLIFGDDFNGPQNGDIDPEHWLLDVSSTSDEDDYYRPTHVYLDGSGHLVLKSTDDAYGGKPYTSGCIQNNTLAFYPGTSGWTITFETSAQVCSGLNDGMWPACWLSGTGYQESFKTDQTQHHGWDNDTYAEVDYAEWYLSGTNTYGVNTWAGGQESNAVNAGVNLSLAQHIYRVDYKPNASCKYYLDGSLKYTHTSQKPIGAMFHMWFQQIVVDSTPSSPQYTYVDYLRIYDRDLG